MSLSAVSSYPFYRSQFAPAASFFCIPLIFLIVCSPSLAQRQLPYLDDARNSPFGQVNFEEIYQERLNLESSQRNRIGVQEDQFEPGTVSALDMMAPEAAVKNFKQANSLLKMQKVKQAIQSLQDAIKTYPKFVSAHIVLGLVYFDLRDKRAKDEFELATKLDDQFPTSFLYLGAVSLWSNNFDDAAASLEKAAFLSPNDPQILIALAFAQNGAHKYADVLQTVRHIHSLDHSGMAAAHYIAAAAALSLHDINTGKAELTTFLSEDRSGPLSPLARQKLDELVRGKDTLAAPAAPASIQSEPTVDSVRTFPNSPHLESELDAAATAPEGDSGDPPESASIIEFDQTLHTGPATDWANSFTIRQAVDETALLLAVSEHGQMVNNLSVSDIQIRDDNKPPERILQFLPQSNLPLRLGVLIDTSGSVEHRVAFEKTAAKAFLEKVLNPKSDLAFVAGFGQEVSVTQDFTSDAAALEEGVDRLGHYGEGTGVFDAIYFASWKLAAYPDQDRVSRVLVVLTDGEDNTSRRSLKQSIEAAEAAGITVYTFNTSENIEPDSDANKVLHLIAERSGGESVYPRTLHELERYFHQLSEVIRSRYLIAYKPAGFIADGRYRQLKVTAARDGKRLRVHVRKGYYARLTESR